MTTRQPMIYKTVHRKLQDRATRTPLKTGNVLKCSGRVNSQLCIQCCATQPIDAPMRMLNTKRKTIYILFLIRGVLSGKQREDY